MLKLSTANVLKSEEPLREYIYEVNKEASQVMGQSLLAENQLAQRYRY